MFKESEIRPKQAEKKANELRIEDIKLLFYKDGRIDKSCFVEVPCPACGKETNSVEFEKQGFEFKRCPYCNTVYVSPRPNANKLHEYYKNSKSIEYFTKEILEKKRILEKIKFLNKEQRK